MRLRRALQILAILLIALATMRAKSRFSRPPETSALDRRLPDVRFTGASVNEVVGFVERQTNLRVSIDREALRERDGDSAQMLEGIFHQPNVRQLLSAPFLARGQSVELVEDLAGVRVTVPGSSCIFRAYAVRDIVSRIQRRIRIGSLAPDQIVWVPGDPPPTDAGPPTDDVALDYVSELVRQNVEPDSWMVNGGITAHVVSRRGYLFVTHSRSAQRRIGELLQALRYADPQ